MNEGTSDRVRENNSEEEVKKISPVPTTSYRHNESTTQEDSTEDNTCPRSTHERNFYSKLSLRNFLKAFKSYVLSSEDDIHLQCARKVHGLAIPEKEPMFVIVDSSGLSCPSSKELLVERITNHNTDTIFAKILNKKVIPNDFPSTSTDLRADLFLHPPVTESVSRDEVLMIDINLQSDNDIPIDDFDDNDSVVVSYLRSRSVLSEIDGSLLMTKKKSSLLESLPKLETIVEGKQYPEKSDQTLDLEAEFEENKKEQ